MISHCSLLLKFAFLSSESWESFRISASLKFVLSCWPGPSLTPITEIREPYDLDSKQLRQDARARVRACEHDNMCGQCRSIVTLLKLRALAVIIIFHI